MRVGRPEQGFNSSKVLASQSSRHSIAFEGTKTVLIEPGGQRIMTQQSEPTPNDQRSDVNNPNNPAYDADQANRTKQDQENAEPEQQKQPEPTATPKK